MKKTAIIGFLLIFWIVAKSQDDILKTETFSKTEYYSDGKISKIRNYRIDWKYIDKETAFFYDNISSDSIVIDTFRINTELYNYDEKRELINIKINDYNSYYSPDKEIKLIKSTYYITNRTGTINDITIQLDNYSKETYIIKPKFESNSINFKSNELIINPLYKNTITLTLMTLPNSNTFEIFLEHDNFKFPITINTFGYNLSSKDLNSTETIELNNQFIYYRTGREALLEVLDMPQEVVLETISLATEIKQIDLSNLESGEYWFRFRIYAYDEIKLVKIKMK